MHSICLINKCYYFKVDKIYMKYRFMKPLGSALSSVCSLPMSRLVVSNVRISGSDLLYRSSVACHRD